MGLFTSNCVKCHAEISWFLEAHDRVCKICGTFNSKEDIERTWREHYDTYQAIMEHFKRRSLSEVKEIFKDNPIAQVTLSKIYWVGPPEISCQESIDSRPESET